MIKFISFSYQFKNIELMFSQLLLIIQQFELRKSKMNQSIDQNKSIDKHSSHESDDKKKARPSLFPLRNSAKRKSSLSEPHHLFNPHCQFQQQKTDATKNQEQYSNQSKDKKSQTQFYYRTPSIESDYSSPRSARLTPKQFIFDTPYVPFVHQSLTKTIWQSQQTIPQERDDIQRKQSQTQNIKAQLILQQQEQQVKQEKNTQNYYKNNQQHQIQNNHVYFQSVSGQYQSKQQNNDIPDIGNINDMIKIQNQNNHKLHEQNNFQQQLAVSINVPASSISAQQKNQISDTLLNNYNNSSRVQSLHQQSESSTSKNKQFVYKQQTTYKEQSQNNQFFYSQMPSTIIQHNVYVSKAPIYYEQEQQTLNRQLEYSPQYHLQIEENKEYNKDKRKCYFGFSYIQSISVQPNPKITHEYGQITNRPNFNRVSLGNIKINAVQKSDQFTQIAKIKLEIDNAHNNQIKSVKKQDYQMQLSYNQRLKIINQCYEQKIGSKKSFNSTNQQTQLHTRNCANQTQQKKGFKIHQQVNFSVSNNYGQHLDQKLTRIQNYIRNLYQQKQTEVQTAKNKNKKTSDKQINTDLNFRDNLSPSAQKKPNNLSAKKSIRNFGCQYDMKDAGIRPSLKRVSIADTKIIYDIDESNSTETFDQQQKNKQRKTRNSSKQKKKQQRVSVKLQQQEQQQQQFQPAKPVEQNKKSKRKGSKTPRKKKSKN